jgi:hypothetical protein
MDVEKVQEEVSPGSNMCGVCIVIGVLPSFSVSRFFSPTNYPHELLRVTKGVCRIVLAVPIEVHLDCSASWIAIVLPRDCWILCRRKASLRFMDQSGASPETSTLMNVGHVLCMARLPLT